MVEVNHQGEWDFLIEFVVYHSSEFDTGCGYNTLGDPTGPCKGFLGVQDIGNTDTFHYIHSGKSVCFFDWEAGGPDDGNQDCVYLDDDSRQMFDAPCFTYFRSDRTVCELGGDA